MPFVGRTKWGNCVASAFMVGRCWPGSQSRWENPFHLCRNLQPWWYDSTPGGGGCRVGGGTEVRVRKFVVARGEGPGPRVKGPGSRAQRLPGWARFRAACDPGGRHTPGAKAPVFGVGYGTDQAVPRRDKSKGNSRFPAGMTERKATTTATAKYRGPSATPQDDGFGGWLSWSEIRLLDDPSYLLIWTETIWPATRGSLTAVQVTKTLEPSSLQGSRLPLGVKFPATKSILYMLLV